MLLRHLLVIVGCVQLLFAVSSATTYCPCSPKTTASRAVCTLTIVVDVSACQCAINNFDTCPPTMTSKCQDCCQNRHDACGSDACHSYTSCTCEDKDDRPIAVTCNLTNAPDTNGQRSSTTSTTDTDAIIGGVVGGVGGLILIAAIVVIVIVIYRRRRKSPSNSPSERETYQIGQRNENGYYANEQNVNPPPFNPTVEPNSYDNNYPIVAPGMSHGSTNETTVIDNQFYAGNPPSETVTMATGHEANDTTLVDNQFYAGNPSEPVTMATGDTTVVDNSFYGRNPVDTTTTGYDNVGR